jgi:hypothetical protein
MLTFVIPKPRKDGTARCFHTKETWPMCTVCQGRIHLSTCTSKKNRLKDCCDARHKMLYEQGHTHGLDDNSVVMWTPEAK